MNKKKKNILIKKSQKTQKRTKVPWPKGKNKDKSPEQLELLKKHQMLNKQFNGIFDNPAVSGYEMICGDELWAEFCILSVEEKKEWLSNFNRFLREEFGHRFTLLKLVK